MAELGTRFEPAHAFDSWVSRSAELAKAEARRGFEKLNGLNSLHEGYAVLLEEVEEFWDEVKSQAPVHGRTEAELIQVAAVALRLAACVRRKECGG